jgi:multiphosphoryl transfer protein
VDEIRAELSAPVVPVGIMIEIPAAALLADLFAREVDFFSIGTNDLTQYTLAMDRMHPTLASKSDGLHPAVLRLIDATVRGAHAAGKWVGVCGELGADPQAAPILLGLGVDELSVSVPSIALVKAQIRTLTLKNAKQLAAKALACATAGEVRALVSNWVIK